MSRQEHPSLRWLNNTGIPSGEIISVTSESIVIEGIFAPGLTHELRSGERVFVVTADDAIALLRGVEDTNS